MAELEKIVLDRTADIELVKEEVNHAEVHILWLNVAPAGSCMPADSVWWQRQAFTEL